MKFVPNVLSITRIILASSLLILSLLLTDFVLSPMFLIIYTIAGITDMIDGPIARKFNVASQLGANLDGIADYTFVAIALILIIPALNFSPLLIAIIVIGFVLLKVIGMIVGYIRYKQLMMMHTYGAKLGALLAFLFPLFYHFSGFDENIIIIFLGIYVYLFLIEEIVINTVLPEPNRDIKGLYQALQIRRQMKTGNE